MSIGECIQYLRLFMKLRIRHLVIFMVCALFGWVGWSGYIYFFDTTIPYVVLGGFGNKQYCAGDVQCIVTSNKSGDISVWLDEKPLINKFNIKSRHLEHPFTIPTRTIANGNHSLKVVFVDSTYHQNKTILERTFNVDNIALQAAFVRSDSEYKVFQGRTLHVQFQVNKEIADAKVHVLSQEYDCFPESKNSHIYECFIPITCEEQPNEYLVSIDMADKVGNALRLDNKFQVVKYPFKKTELHVSEEKVKREEELGHDTQFFEQEIAKIMHNSPREKLWRGAFCTPIDITRTTGEFGTIRTARHRGRYAHKALDIINVPKSVVWAPQEGKIVLKDRFALSGNTVVIDHGWGIISLFFHLDDFAKIEVGDMVKKGNPIGYIGKTGYAQGYHLHWEMRVNNIQVDPMQWTKATF